jgi:uncharacterized protein YceH (UPF0502 family)
MEETLNEIERRVLGVLLEKSLAQPQVYPMSVNAIVTACNQKSNRDPVMSLDEETVWDTLERLRAVGLVARLMPGGASRVDRFRHEVKNLLGWEKPQWAVMAELLLRGPQTVGELRGRCTRLYPFENTEMISAVLDNLSQEQPPRVQALPRAPGQSAVRYAHLLYPAQEWEQLTATPTSASAPAPPALASAGSAMQTPAPSRPGGSQVTAELEQLRGEVENAHAEIVELHEQLADLRRRVETLEG